MMRSSPKTLMTEFFVKSSEGGITVLAISFLILALMVGGLAIDVSNLMTARTQLQIAADSTAHAALLEREFKTEADAKVSALALLQRNMPSSQFGDLLTTNEIEFGLWDAVSETFTPVSGEKSAVRVQPKRMADSGNGVATFLLGLIGIDEWNLRVRAVFVTYNPTCFKEGFVAKGVVDLQSNNSYTNGFCIHSNQYVSLNSNNYFEPGTVVSMPNPDDIQLPNSGYKTNVGLQSALRKGSFYIRIIEQVDAVIAGLEDFNSDYMPNYITSTAIITLDPKNAINQTVLVSGRLHKLTCPNGGRANVSAGTLFSQIVLVTNCELKLGNGVVLEDAIIATTNTSANSLNAASSIQVGRNDGCASGGGAQLVSMGGMSFPANLMVYGGQLLAKGDISFAANANGVEGASFVSGGVISGTSNMAMGFCGAGMEDNIVAEYFRLGF